MTFRDANAHPMLDCIDFRLSAVARPPKLAAPLGWELAYQVPHRRPEPAAPGPANAPPSNVARGLAQAARS